MGLLGSAMNFFSIYCCFCCCSVACRCCCCSVACLRSVVMSLLLSTYFLLSWWRSMSFSRVQVFCTKSHHHHFLAFLCQQVLTSELVLSQTGSLLLCVNPTDCCLQHQELLRVPSNGFASDGLFALLSLVWAFVFALRLFPEPALSSRSGRSQLSSRMSRGDDPKTRCLARIHCVAQDCFSHQHLLGTCFVNVQVFLRSVSHHAKISRMVLDMLHVTVRSRFHKNSSSFGLIT